MTAAIKKPASRFALIAALTMGLLLAASISSALAASGGKGAFNAAAHINVLPPPFGEPCATYSNYNAELTFTAPENNSTSVFTASSDPDPLSSNFQWGEFGDGTHHPQTSATGTTSCSDDAGQAEAGFTGTLTTDSGNCVLSGGSYARTNLDVTYTFTGITGSCGRTTPPTVTAKLVVLQHFDPPLSIPPGIEITDLTACNSIIAPTTCALEEGSY